jgi:cytochrome b561
VIVAFLALWWLVGAISFSVAKTNDGIVDVTNGARKVVRASSWLLFLLFIVSAVTAWLIARRDEAPYDPFTSSAPPQFETSHPQQGTGYSEFA